MRISRLIWAALFALIGTEKLSSQSNTSQSNAPMPSTAMTATIYITAATKKNDLIENLKPEDLSITEDKVPAKIEQVSCGKRSPIVIGVLVDVSGSRRSDPYLSSHYDALVAFLDSLLTPDDGTYVAAFDDEPHTPSAVTSDRAAISAAFDDLRKHEPHASTALYDAIEAMAKANLFVRKGRRILLVIGDWEDNSSHVFLEKAVEAAQRSAMTVFAIVDGGERGEESKKAHQRALSAANRFAEETGGLAYAVYDKEDFARFLKTVHAVIAASCRVEYTTSKGADPKKGAQVQLQANSKDVWILYPRVRFASPQ